VQKRGSSFPTLHILCFVFNQGGIYPWRAPVKEARLNPFMLAWMTNASNSPDLNIEFSTDSTRTDSKASKKICAWSYKFWTIRLVMEITRPQLEISREPLKSPYDKFQSQRKRKPRSATSICSNYWQPSYHGSVCILTISCFRPSGNAGLQSPSKSVKPISQYPPSSTVPLQKTPPAIEIHDKRTNF
jgi:hypothetical protein